MTLSWKPLAAVTCVAVLSCGLTACGESAVDKANKSEHNMGESKQNQQISIKSCGETLTFDKAPENVLMLSEMNVSILHELGVLDRVKHRAGEKRVNKLDADLEAAIANIPSVKAGDTGTGGAKMSTESIVDLHPDLVIGYDTGADRQALKDAGIPLYSPDALCPDIELTPASWDKVTDEVDKMGSLFQVEGKAKELKEKIAKKTPQVSASTANGVVLYITPGSDVFYTYGNTSMVQPILEANGLKNPYSDNKERVFDVSMEDLLDKNPEWIVLLSETGDDKAAMETFLGFNGARSLKAVQEHKVVHMPFILTDPPSTLSVEGAVYLQNQMKNAGM